MLRRLIPVFSALALLAACATAPPAYTPAATASGTGYSETRIENDRYFVTYRARSAADAALISDYALLRAAEITLERGKSWFWVDRRSLDEQNTANSGPSVSVGVGGGNYGRRSGVGVGVGFSIPIGGPQAPRATSATVEIRLGDGPKPDDPNAYDARGVSTSLRSRLATG
jgi:hypothetical protein